MALDWVLVGGFGCGLMAGAGARYGRICSMGAIEDGLVGHDYRAARAWGVGLAAAMMLTEVARLNGIADVGRSAYAGASFNLLALVLGGALFGLGMTLIGTCSFGLIVRAGGGDLRAVVAAGIVGTFAFAATSGLLAPARTALLTVGTVTAGPVPLGAPAGVRTWLVGALSIFLVGLACLDVRLLKRPRLLLGAVAIGTAVAAGWVVTTLASQALAQDRIESLSFVAPVGRALLQFMMEPFRQLGFGVASVAGALVGSMAIALIRKEARWEAFDDPREMRRHMGGAALMGLGGVLAHGCTIGQGMSAGSILAPTAPLFLIAVVAGAKIGLVHLIEGRPLWHFGFRPRQD